jgi:hypothetical protein
MADLWIYGRKPAALVRHRHGGFNATFPMNGDTVEEQAGRMRDLTAARERAARSEKDRPPRIEGMEAQNVLRFQPRAARGDSRGGDGRGGDGRGGGHGPRGGRPGPYRD